MKDSRVRSFIKSLTFLLVMFVVNGVVNNYDYLLGDLIFKYGLIEVLSTVHAIAMIVFYFVHERLWERFNWQKASFSLR